MPVGFAAGFAKMKRIQASFALRKCVLQDVPEQYRADREVLVAAAARDASCICLADKALQKRLGKIGRPRAASLIGEEW